MARPTRNRITKMTIGEISAVDDPANPHATVDLFKARSATAPKADDLAKANAAADVAEATASGYITPETAALIADLMKENAMDPVALAAALETAETRLDTLEKANSEGATALAAANARADTAEAALAKAKEAEGKTDDEIDAEVMKSLPAAVRVRLEKAAVQGTTIAKMLADKEEGDAIAKAKVIGIGDAKEVGPLLVRIAKGMTTAEDATKVEAILKAASAQVAAGALFKSAGVVVLEDFGGSPQDILKARADEIIKAKPGMTREAAEMQVFESQPALYDAVNKRPIA
jgi:hypothetical protein